MKTLFEKIIQRELPAEIIFENEKIIVIKDKYPKAPIHLLLITKKMIEDMQSIQEEDLLYINEIFRVVPLLAKRFGLEEGGYRVLVNVGPDGGQEIYHLHFHLLGGRALGSMG